MGGSGIFSNHHPPDSPTIDEPIVSSRSVATQPSSPPSESHAISPGPVNAESPNAWQVNQNRNLSPTRILGRSVEDLDGFSSMVDEMAFNVWKCHNCFSMAHITSSCTNQTRCRRCFWPGHRAKSCTVSAPSGGFRWVPCVIESPSNSPPPVLRLDASSSLQPTAAACPLIRPVDELHLASSSEPTSPPPPPPPLPPSAPALPPPPRT